MEIPLFQAEEIGGQRLALVGRHSEIRHQRAGLQVIGILDPVWLLLIAATIAASVQMIEAQRQRDAALYESQRAEFQARFGQSMLEVYKKEIQELMKLGLIEECEDNKVRITRRGRLLGNQVFLRFV